jgi:hypothetical protein
MAGEGGTDLEPTVRRWAISYRAEPKVRIHLPPAESLRTLGPSRKLRAPYTTAGMETARWIGLEHRLYPFFKASFAASTVWPSTPAAERFGICDRFFCTRSRVR